MGGLPFFFYGTLLDDDVCRIVLGPASLTRRRVPAVLPAYKRVRGRDGDYPVLRRWPGAKVVGQLVYGLSRVELCLLGHFEAEHYNPVVMTLRTLDRAEVEAWVFLPREPAMAGVGPWNFKRWKAFTMPRLMPLWRRWDLEPGADRL